MRANLKNPRSNLKNLSQPLNLLSMTKKRNPNKLISLNSTDSLIKIQQLAQNLNFRSFKDGKMPQIKELSEITVMIRNSDFLIISMRAGFLMFGINWKTNSKIKRKNKLWILSRLFQKIHLIQQRNSKKFWIYLWKPFTASEGETTKNIIWEF